MKNHLQNHGDTFLQFLWGIQRALGLLKASFAARRYLFFGTGWCPPVISWFINPINYSYIYHKP